MNVTPEDRRRLEAIVSDRSAPQKHVWRAKIVLATADGCGTADNEIMRRSGKSKRVVCGDGRRGSWRRASRDLRATRRANPASRRCHLTLCSGWWTWRSGRRREKQPIGRAEAG
jgi:hypothetical protein